MVAAQRWVRLILSGQPNPPLFEGNAKALRDGIKKVVGELNLPLNADWHKGNHTYGVKIGVSMEAYT